MDNKWRRLKEFIEADMQGCERTSLRLAKEKNSVGEGAWHMAWVTDRMILDEMARLEKEEESCKQ